MFVFEDEETEDVGGEDTASAPVSGTENENGGFPVIIVCVAAVVLVAVVVVVIVIAKKKKK